MPPKPGSQSRATKRYERYNEARALEFSVEDARRLRDLSGSKFQQVVSQEQRRISRKPERLRTPEESFRLKRIQDRNKFQTKVQQEQRVMSRIERWKRFQKFSKNNVWPKYIKKEIIRFNRRHGKDDDDSFGYRQYYYKYVERLDIDEASELADRNDSGMRWLMNKSLIRGRINIRHLINPPGQQKKKSA